MAHIREVRPHARELKFVVEPDRGGRDPAAGLERISTPTRTASDRLATSTRRPASTTTTAAYDVFHRRGSFGRSKYRIRRYGDEQTVFLERKLRQPAVLAKRRTSLSLSSLSRLTEPALDAGLARLLVPPSRDGQAAAAGLSGDVFADGAGRRSRRRTSPSDARLRPSGPAGERYPLFDSRKVCRPWMDD